MLVVYRLLKILKNVYKRWTTEP